jgi:mannose-6-phosphate isomerase-like protein (cupin superfamily)
MSSGHLVCPAEEAAFTTPSDWGQSAAKYRRWTVVDQPAGALHTGFGVCELGPDGSVPTHVHSFEESFFVTEGNGTVRTAEGAFRVSAGDYGLLPVGVPHAWHNDRDAPVRWAEMQAPAPREQYGGDTLLVPSLPDTDAVDLDVRDPRTRRFGTITPEHMDPARQGQQMLAVSASMRTALLVYSGITVKMMVDSDLGAQLSTMFMVQYAPEGVAGAHDHPFEETYFFLEGEAEATFDGVRYVLRKGDVAWAGVGCVHSFRNLGQGPLRWLETQSPQPPARHSYRFARDWDYLKGQL